MPLTPNSKTEHFLYNHNNFKRTQFFELKWVVILNYTKTSVFYRIVLSDCIVCTEFSVDQVFNSGRFLSPSLFVFEIWGQFHQQFLTTSFPNRFTPIIWCTCYNEQQWLFTLFCRRAHWIWKWSLRPSKPSKLAA